MQNVFVLVLEGYSRDLTKIRCGIRDLTATCEAGFPKVWAEGCGIGKEKYIRDSDDRSSECGILVKKERETRYQSPPSSPFLFRTSIAWFETPFLFRLLAPLDISPSEYKPSSQNPLGRFLSPGPISDSLRYSFCVVVEAGLGYT